MTHRYAAVLSLALVLVVGCKKKETQNQPAQPTSTAGGTSAPAASVEVSILCASLGIDFETCKAGAQRWEKKTGNKVRLVSSPTSTTERLAMSQQQLASGASDIDVFLVDVVWPGILGTFFLDLKPYSKGSESEHFPAIVANNTLDGKLVAMPWFNDVGLLFYRKDLLDKYKEPVPTTWDQLTATAKKIQDAEREAGQKDMWGFVFQGKAYEGLTCVALEWVASFGGGTVIDNTGKITIDNPAAAAALDTAATWIGMISPPGTLNYEEEEARGVFQSGNAVFMRNWSYAYALAQGPDSPIKGKIGITTVPKGNGPDARGASTLGGWNLAVSKFSKHPEQAFDFVLFLTSAEEQKRRALAGAYRPTIEKLYEDKEILDSNPSFADSRNAVNNAVQRPATVAKGKYNQVSTAFWNATQTVLNKQKTGAQAVAELKTKLEQLSRGGAW